MLKLFTSWNDGEITEFLSHVYGLVDMHVARYIERGFTNLMFSLVVQGGNIEAFILLNMWPNILVISLVVKCS